MAIVNIKAKNGETKVEAEFDYDFPETIDGLVESYGNELVYDSFVATQKIKAQAVIRQLLASGKSPEEVKEFMEQNWAPGKSVADPTASFLAKFADMSPEEQQRQLAILMERAKS